jgi:N-dimethylarginine dimethylaminohydrolase
MIDEMEAFSAVLKKNNVKVYRPEMIENYNQIFSRDIGFVIDDIFIKSNILPRELDENNIDAFLLLIKNGSSTRGGSYRRM